MRIYVFPAYGRQVSPIPLGGVQPDGRFRTAGLPPGRYVLLAGADAYRVRALHVEGRESIPAVVEIGMTDVDVVLTLSDRIWSLSGVVRDQAGRPVSGGRLIVFPRDRVQWQVAGLDAEHRVAQVNADHTGAFQTTGSIPGDYLAAAVASPPEFWMAPEYLQTLVPIATPVRLELGGKQTIELRLR